jgi:hypothetical protein
MAADTKGKFNAILREKRVEREASLGRTWEYAGTNSFADQAHVEAPKSQIVPSPKPHTLG